MTDRMEIARIIDANLNRAKEGIRVLEEVARFIKNDEVLSKQLKSFRHSIVQTVMEFGLTRSELLSARDSEKDVGRKLEGSLESQRSKLEDITASNFSRVLEALRVIEEFGKVVSPEASRKIKDLRYDFYTLEKKLDVKYLEYKKERERNTSGDGWIVILVLIIVAAIIYFIYSQRNETIENRTSMNSYTYITAEYKNGSWKS